MNGAKFPTNMPSLILCWRVLGFMIGACLMLLLSTDTGWIAQRQIVQVNPLGSSRTGYLLSDIPLQIQEYADHHQANLSAQTAALWFSEMPELESLYGRTVEKQDRYLQRIESFAPDVSGYAASLRWITSKVHTYEMGIQSQGVTIINGKAVETVTPKKKRLHELAKRGLKIADRALALQPHNLFFAVEKVYLMGYENPQSHQGNAVFASSKKALEKVRTLNNALRMNPGDKGYETVWMDWMATERGNLLNTISSACGYLPASTKIAMMEQYNSLQWGYQANVFGSMFQLMEEYQQRGEYTTAVAIRCTLASLGIYMIEQNTVSSVQEAGSALLNLATTSSVRLDAPMFQNSIGELGHNGRLVPNGYEELTKSLRKHGFEAEASWFEDTVQPYLNVPTRYAYFPSQLSLVLWMANHLFLSLTVFFVACGSVASLWLYRRRFQLERGHKIAVQNARGATLGILLGAFVLFYNSLMGTIITRVYTAYNSPSPEGVSHILVPFVSVKLPFLAVLGSLALLWFLTKRGQLMTNALLSYCVTSGLLWLLFALSNRMLLMVLNTIAPLRNRTSTLGEDVMIGYWVSLGTLVAVPLLCAFVMLMVSLAKNKPTMETIAQGIGRSTVPAVVFLLLLFMGNTLYLSRWEKGGQVYANVLATSANTEQLQPMIDNLHENPLQSLFRRVPPPVPEPGVRYTSGPRPVPGVAAPKQSSPSPK